MFSKKRVLPFKSYFYFLPHLFSFADNKFFLFHFNAHKSNYVNEGVKAKLAFSSSKHNYLTTPSPSCLSPIIRSLLLNFLFNLVSGVLSYPPLRSERAREILVGSGHECPRAKLILREEFLISQFFVCFSVCHHTIDPSFRFHRSQWLQEQHYRADTTAITVLKPWEKKQSNLV